jgi:hypothetical protein
MGRVPTPSVTTPPTYLDRLLGELDAIEARYLELLAASGINNIDPNRPGSGVVFIGAAKWGWAASDTTLEASRMELLRDVRGWAPRLRLLFPHPTPTVTKELDVHLGRLENWLVRERGDDHSVPPTIAQALKKIGDGVAALRDLTQLLPADSYAVRLVVDTNSLIDNSDLAAYTPLIGHRYMAHLLPVVLREIDDHKRGGRNPDLREAAKRADRRLKGLRTNGDVLAGVRVAGDIYVTFEHVEPKEEGLPSWLDLDVPDDRFVASTLLLQSAHPGSALFAATSDINLQTKLSAVGMPFVEVPCP